MKFLNLRSHKAVSRYICVLIAALLMSNSILISLASDISPSQATPSITSGESQGSSTGTDTGNTQGSGSAQSGGPAASDGAGNSGGSEGTNTPGGSEGSQGNNISENGNGTEAGGSENGDGTEAGGSENGDGTEAGGSENGDGTEAGGSENGDGTEAGGSENGDGTEAGGSENGDGTEAGGSENGDGTEAGGSENGDGTEGNDGSGDGEGSQGNDGSSDTGSGSGHGNGSEDGGNDEKDDEHQNPQGGDDDDDDDDDQDLDGKAPEDLEGGEQPPLLLPANGLFTFSDKEIIDLMIQDFELKVTSSSILSGASTVLSFQIGLADGQSGTDVVLEPGELLLRLQVPKGISWNANPTLFELPTYGSEDEPSGDNDDPDWDYIWLINKAVFEPGQIYSDSIDTIRPFTTGITDDGAFADISAHVFYAPGAGNDIIQSKHSDDVSITARAESLSIGAENAYSAPATATDDSGSQQTSRTIKLQDTGDISRLYFSLHNIAEATTPEYGRVFGQGYKLTYDIDIETIAGSGDPKILIQASGLQARNHEASAPIGTQPYTTTQDGYKLTYSLGENPVTKTIDGKEYLVHFQLLLTAEQVETPPTEPIKMTQNVNNRFSVYNATLHPDLVGRTEAETETPEFQAVLTADMRLETVTPGYAVNLDGQTPYAAGEEIPVGQSIKHILTFTSEATPENLNATAERGITKEHFSNSTRLYDSDPTDKYVWKGDIVTHAFHDFGNEQREAMKTFTLTDSGYSTAELQPLVVYTGSYQAKDEAWLNANTYKVILKNGSASNHTIADIPFTASRAITVTDPGVTEIIFEYGEVPPGFQPNESDPPRADFRVLANESRFASTAVADAPNETNPDVYHYNNRATLTFSYEDNPPNTVSDTWYERYKAQIEPTDSLNKEAWNVTAQEMGQTGRALQQGDLLEFTLTVTNKTSYTFQKIAVNDYYSKYLAPDPEQASGYQQIALTTVEGSANKITAVKLLPYSDSPISQPAGYADQFMRIELDTQDFAPGDTVTLKYQMRVTEIDTDGVLVSNYFVAYGNDNGDGGTSDGPGSGGGNGGNDWDGIIDTGRWGWEGSNQAPSALLHVTRSRRPVDPTLSDTRLINGDEVIFDTVIFRDDRSGSDLTLTSIYDFVAEGAYLDLPVSGQENRVTLKLDRGDGSGIDDLGFTIAPALDSDPQRFRVDLTSPLPLEYGYTVTLTYTAPVQNVTSKEGTLITNNSYVALKESIGESPYVLKKGENDPPENHTAYLKEAAGSVIKVYETVTALADDTPIYVSVIKNDKSPLALGSNQGLTYNITLYNYSGETLVVDSIVDILPEYERVMGVSIDTSFTSERTNLKENEDFRIEEVDGFDHFGNPIKQAKLIVYDFSKVDGSSTLSIAPKDVIGESNWLRLNYTVQASKVTDGDPVYANLFEDLYNPYGTVNTVNYGAFYLDNDTDFDRLEIYNNDGKILDDTDDWDEDPTSLYRLQAQGDSGYNVRPIFPLIKLNPETVTYNGSTFTYSSYTDSSRIVAGQYVGWNLAVGNHHGIAYDTLLKNNARIAVVLPAGTSFRGLDSHATNLSGIYKVENVYQNAYDQEIVVFSINKDLKSSDSITFEPVHLLTSTAGDLTGSMQAQAYIIPGDVVEQGVIQKHQRFYDSQYVGNQDSFGTPVWENLSNFSPDLPDETLHMVKATAEVKIVDQFSSESIITIADDNSHTTNSTLARPRVIVLDQGDDTVTFTMEVHNTRTQGMVGQASDNLSYTNLVLVNRLPAAGDVMNLTPVSRGTNAGMRLLDNPQIRAEILPVDENNQNIPVPLDPSDYEVEYSAVSGASYTKADWKIGNGTAAGNWQSSLPAGEAAAIRFTLKTPLPTEYRLVVSFQAAFDPDAIEQLAAYGNPQAIAYDSFAYGFTAMLNGALTSVRAEPFAVGATFNLPPQEPGTITLNKKDKITGQAISGAEFTLKQRAENGNFYDYNPGDGLGAKRLTDDQGSLAYEKVEPGVYLLKESSTPAGYLAGSLELTGNGFDLSADGSFLVQEAASLTFTATNQPITGGIVVIKSSTDGDGTLPGAEFSLLDSLESPLRENLKTDLNGKLAIDNLTAGSYILRETKAPAGHQLPTGSAADTAFELRIKGSALVLYLDGVEQSGLELEIFNMPKEALPGKITLTKTDADNSAIILQGVSFTLLRRVNSEWQPYLSNQVTDGRGQVIFDPVEPGTYKLDEITPPPGYKAGSLKLTGVSIDADGAFQVEEAADLRITATNEQLTGDVTVVKYATGAATGLAGAEFDLTFEGNGYTWTGLTTDSNGILSIPGLTAGAYTLTETKAPVDHVLPSNPVTQFELRPNADSTALVLYQNGVEADILQLVIYNDPRDLDPGKITLTKQDAANSTVLLEGVSFTLLRKTGSGWEAAATGQTDGQGQVIFDPVEPGTYKLDEITPPPGYKAGSLKLTGASIDADGSFQVGENADLQLVATNEQLVGKVEVHKLSTGTDIGLNGAVFTLTRLSDNRVWRNLITEEGGILILDGLTAGAYTLTETKAPQDHVLPSNPVTQFELRPNADSTALVLYQNGVEADILQLVIYNDPRDLDPGKITLTKQDAANSTVLLEGVSFTLLRKTGSGWEAAATGQTDGQGQVIFDPVEPGTYKLDEITPPPGYKAGSLKLTGVSIDADGSFQVGENADLQLVATNEQLVGKVEVHKLSTGTDIGLNGAVFTLTRLSDNRVWRNLITEEGGILILDGLTAGAYTLTETKAPQDHVLPSNPVIQFELKPNAGNTGLVLYQNGIESDTLEIIIENQPYVPSPGVITLTKQDAASAHLLSGAVFDLEVLTETGWQPYVPTDGGGPARRTTDADGRITYRQVLPGTYRFIEVAPPDGYEAGTLVMTGESYSPENGSFLVEENAGVFLLATNKKLLGDVALRKYSKGTTTGLSGAVFSLYDGSNTLLRQGLSTGSDGSLTITGLSAGDYRLVETQAPSGYILPQGDAAVTAFTLSPDENSNHLELSQGGTTQATLLLTIENEKKPDEPKKPTPPGTNEPDTDRERPGTTRPPRVRFPSQTVNIPDEDVPLINMLIDIIDEQVPLGFFNPSTGGVGSLLLLLCSLLAVGAGLALGWPGKRKGSQGPQA